MSIESQRLFEIVDIDGKPITNHYINRKSVYSAVKLYQKHDEEFWQNHWIREYEVVFKSEESIDPLKSEEN